MHNHTVNATTFGNAAKRFIAWLTVGLRTAKGKTRNDMLKGLVLHVIAKTRKCIKVARIVCYY